jgi:tetratricopeptide repeat protein 30
LKLNAEFVSESDVFKLNVAHCFYMQETKYKEAIKYYEYICKKNYHSILTVTPSILANLCVSYIMCSENEEAEELMRLIEKEEEKSTNSQPQPYHLCIVNLVIGTLYCSKGNFEFGVSRIIKSFDPLAQKLNLDTWFYAKKNVLSVLEYVAKSMFVMKRELFDEIDGFLSECEKEGKAVKVRVPGVETSEGDEWKNNVTYEARMLKRLLYKLKE